MIKNLVIQSNSRHNYLARTSTSSIQTPITTQSFQYTVKVRIGIFKSRPPYKEYYSDMDTGSGLVWMQCDGCTKCFKQTPKPFPKQNSSSFRLIMGENNKTLPYYYEYEDGGSTRGILARETFYLTKKNGGLEKIENLESGCGLNNNIHFGGSKNKVAGVMGLGWDDSSFMKQLGPQIKGLFWYCLPILSSKTPTTYLRFGDDAVHQQNSKMTPLYKRNEDSSPYYVDLHGITVVKTRLNINPRVFEFKCNGTIGGCIIDSGTPYSRIVGPAYDALELELEKYFSRFKGLKKIKGSLDLDLCYERSKPENYTNLPTITFHLRGANFVMRLVAVFQVVGRSFPTRLREYFCLAMVRDNTDSIIGSHQ